ncbi:hypothetical protein GCM10023185_14340 [Hymenobacter saemangeumensis]|uniref:VWA domain-containing protein n=1 Tax=Hymenobacter saemangeumensis TaxID=1084522 RepID=A0ABP8I8H8_9BACT
MTFLAPPNLLLYYGLLAGCLLLGLGLAVLAWQRPRQRQRGLRAGAGVVAALALWLTAFPPLVAVRAARPQAVLLTTGYHPDTLSTLLRRLGAGTPVYFYGTGEAPSKARVLPSLLDLAEQRPALQRLHVLGQGPAPAELALLGTMAVQHLAPAQGAGFRAAGWNRRLVLGQTVEVEGQVLPLPGNAPVWVSLRAAGAVRDSQLLQGGGDFRLRYRPKAAGLAVYELVLRRAGRVLESAPLPVQVTERQPPAVLLLAATPSFEFKFLKNHLADARYAVALRSTVSRGLQQTEFVNQPTRSLTRLTPALLAGYGILIADAATLAGLSGAESQALSSALRAGRLGLVVLADAAPLPRTLPALAGFSVQARPAAQTAAQPLTWADGPAPAPASLPAQLRPGLQLRALARGPQGALAAASRRVGLGSAVVSVLPETFQWQLQGRPAVYASFWNHLLTAATPPEENGPAWSYETLWPRPHQPLLLHLAAPLPEALPTVKALAGGPAVRLALRQDTRLPEWSTARFWPARTGWHQVQGPGGSVHHFYVFADAVWPGPEQQARRLALAQRTAAAPGLAAAETALQPWPATWFFVLFLLAAGYLWLEEKL